MNFVFTFLRTISRKPGIINYWCAFLGIFASFQASPVSNIQYSNALSISGHKGLKRPKCPMQFEREKNAVIFYPRVHEVYRRVYILLCCSCCSCSWEAFNQTCQYFSRQLIKHDQTWSEMIRHDQKLVQTRSDTIRHDQTWSDTIRHFNQTW
jgi:hypothetical protein